ncbi:NADPH-dependent oxidoreductase [Bordetella tumulicola]|uniref:NADPH-dependent oxidoreductase n=1 Tax=Bordetella tumulicola TaxID=1649133 RepID=UPI0039F050BD
MTQSAPPFSLSSPIAELLTQRYGEEVASDYPVIDNPAIRLALGHRSVRAFSSRPLAPEVLPTLITAAQSASTSSNLQVWSVVAIQDPEHKDQVAHWARNQEFVRQAPLFLVWLADFGRARQVAEQHSREIDGGEFVESVVLASVEAGLAAQNAVLAAESLGLGAVYVGAIRSHIRPLAANLKLPPQVIPVFGTAIGYADEAVAHSIKPRLPQSAVLHHEYYDGATQLPAVDVYNRALDAFWKKQSIEHPLWTAHILNRLKANPADQRYELRSILNDLGFLLR